jgi:lipopolysaccharide/colanic/teichoic acid biosynthesis glycosyltransferase
MLKRLFDISTSIILLFILSPVMLLSALIIIVDNGFPVIYRGLRVGKDGETFYILKFRSMFHSDNTQGPEITAGGDLRITRSGRFLRKWKLDEFPQFFNVLRGDMSIVGPRPESPSYVKYYTDEEKYVLKVRPGITGVTQIIFRNEEQMLDVPDPEQYYIDILMHQKLKYDLAYVKNRSLLLDLLLVFLTIVAIITPRHGVAMCERILNNYSDDSFFIEHKKTRNDMF